MMNDAGNDIGSLAENRGVAVPIDEKTAEALDRLAIHRGCTTEEVLRASVALSLYVHEQTELGNCVQVEDPESGVVRDLFLQ